jgi:DNA-binding transcriptional MerR regulator
MIKHGHVFISGKEYYRVSDVCKSLGIFKNTLYNWERLGKIPKAHRDPMSGWRLYSKQDVELLKKISGRKELWLRKS